MRRNNKHDISLRGDTFRRLKAEAHKQGKTPGALAEEWILLYPPFTDGPLPNLSARPMPPPASAPPQSPFEERMLPPALQPVHIPAPTPTKEPLDGCGYHEL